MRSRLAMGIVAAVACLCGLVIPSAAFAATPQVPSGASYQVENDSHLNWLHLASDGYIQTNTSATLIYVTAGTNQEYRIDSSSGECLTYNSANNEVHELACASKASQEWQSTKISGTGLWYVYNNYLGKGECLQGDGNGSNVTMQTCDSGSDQKWNWTV